MWIKLNEERLDGYLINLGVGNICAIIWDDSTIEYYFTYDKDPKPRHEDFKSRAQAKQKFAELERLLIPKELTLNDLEEFDKKVSECLEHNLQIRRSDKIEIPPLTPKQIWENCTEDFKKAFPYFAINEDGVASHFNVNPFRMMSHNKWGHVLDGYSSEYPFPVNWEGDWKDSLHYKGEPVK